MTGLSSDPAQWLPVFFAALMGLSILVYVILDGFDLGVGLLSPLAPPVERDRMVASIGPFWDANETWLVLAIGLLLVAFPAAHGKILSGLYLPVAVMLIGLILRGVAFEFRVKAPVVQKPGWDRAFFAGSLMASLAQGFMLGIYILGLEWSAWSVTFGALTAICLTTAYAFIGATWLIFKTEDRLQRRSVLWARRSIWGVMLGLAAVSAASPLASPRIFDKWFSVPEVLFLAPLPILSAVVGSMSAYYHDTLDTSNAEERDIFAHRILAKLPTIAAAAYKHNSGQPFMYPRNDLNYCENMLQMFFSVPAEPYEIDPVASEALELPAMRTVDVEQFCSWSACRMNSRSRASEATGSISYGSAGTEKNICSMFSQ